jgi:hypothetical protein
MSLYEVWLNNEGKDLDQTEVYFHNAGVWAFENCASFYGHTVIDVSDVSYRWDQLALYQFHDEQDALIFRLRWA